LIKWTQNSQVSLLSIEFGGILISFNAANIKSNLLNYIHSKSLV
jgi:hypothetical protein